MSHMALTGQADQVTRGQVGLSQGVSFRKEAAEGLFKTLEA